MPMVQQTKKEETASLPVWLGRDVPHERELARELLQTMGREKSLDYLLHLHDLEETRRQKRVRRYAAVLLSCLMGMLPLAVLVLYAEIAVPSGHHLPWLRVCLPLMWAFQIPIHILNYQARGGRCKQTPSFSSAIQQNVITALLDYGDNPLVADALCRATTYYTGDRDRLFDGLGRVLSLLPDDADALTKPARRALASRLLSFQAVAFAGEAARLPALQAAIKDYFARTASPHPKWERFWSKLG